MKLPSHHLGFFLSRQASSGVLGYAMQALQPPKDGVVFSFCDEWKNFVAVLIFVFHCHTGSQRVLVVDTLFNEVSGKVLWEVYVYFYFFGVTSFELCYIVNLKDKYIVMWKVFVFLKCSIESKQG